MRFMIEFFKEPYLILTSEGHRFIEKANQTKKLRDRISSFFINLAFSTILAIPFGFMVMLFIFSLLGSLRLEVEDGYSPYIYLFLPSAGLLFVILISILFLNINDGNKLSIPKIIFLLLRVISSIQLIKQMKIFFAYFITTTIGIAFCLYSVLTWIKIPQDFHGSVIWIIALISSISAGVLFSELTLNKITRYTRAFIFYSLMFIGFLYWSLYQTILYLNSKMDDLTIASFGVSIFGLVFTLSTVVDKGRALLEEQFISNKEMLDKEWNDILSTYHFIDNKKQELTKIVDESKQLWRNGKKQRVVFAIISSIGSIPIVFGVLFTNKYFFEELMPKIIHFLKEKWTSSLFKGNEQLATSTFILFVFLGGLIWSIFNLVRRFKSAAWYTRLILLGRTVLLMIPSLLILGNIFPDIKIFLYNYLMVPLFFVLVVISIFMKFTKKK
ncbi:hypothetical protein I532_24552 [Brevibacillus borstelensis AK1]|uniref:Uncharacterized protein n=1 Tax=Brevibacillus borstelensis AK1 TaxID=1300222 RepID=M8DSV4_9BACL|nr:hypothetical protein [Brevibacillus borstelensis]EMT50016.1 hypothetical protein I532_24552 [Brevibacillus borstelensis AK1]